MNFPDRLTRNQFIILILITLDKDRPKHSLLEICLL
jgi:hypothetical protein